MQSAEEIVVTTGLEAVCAHHAGVCPPQLELSSYGAARLRADEAAGAQGMRGVSEVDSLRNAWTLHIDHFTAIEVRGRLFLLILIFIQRGHSMDDNEQPHQQQSAFRCIQMLQSRLQGRGG